MSEAIRVYFTGDCDGFDALRASLAGNAEIAVVGASEQVEAAASPLAGGHLHFVVHATRAAVFPTAYIAEIREQTRAPVILVASGCEPAAFIEPAIDLVVADLSLLPPVQRS